MMADSFFEHVRLFFYKLFRRDSFQSVLQNTKSSFPQFPPPPPQEILAHRNRYTKALQRRRYLAPDGEDDCPLYSLYRLYENIMLDRNIGLRNEIEYFWHNDAWSVSAIPDPKDEDPARYAVLACIPQMLVLAFNNKIELGVPRDAPSIITYDQLEEYRLRDKKLETIPEWVANVPPLEETLKIPHRKDAYDERKGFIVLEDETNPGASEFFLEKNILILEPHYLFT